MEFDIKRCFSAINADEVKVGSKVIVANSRKDLMEKVEFAQSCTVTLTDIDTDDYLKRFIAGGDSYGLCYLVSEPEEKKLKWTDLKLGDVIKQGTISYVVTGIDTDPSTIKHIHADGCWVLDSELENWEKVEE